MSNSAQSTIKVSHSVSEIEQFSAWILGMAVAVTVFFQVHVALSGGPINVNLADPFAILALAAVSLHVLFAQQFPAWRISQFNLALGMISLLLLLGFVHGWLEIGITQWALSGRLLGWFVLLGYLSAGYMIVANVGTHGLRRFSETLIATAAVVVLLQVVLRLLSQWGLDAGAQLTANFEGYAGNRNAFAIQLLVCIALLLGYSQIYARHNLGLQQLARPWAFCLLLAILLAGLVWTGSRMGILVGMLALLLAGFGRLADHRILCRGVVFGALLWCGIWLAAPNGLNSDNNPAQGNFSSVQGKFSSESSNLERWETLTHGVEMWRQSPVLGAGLGVFHAKSSLLMGHPQVIHSTPVWILAEFGLVGGAVVGWIFFMLGRHAIQIGKSQPASRVLLLLLFSFVLLSLAHEISYQRIFWLVLGALLARPFAFSRHT